MSEMVEVREYWTREAYDCPVCGVRVPPVTLHVHPSVLWDAALGVTDEDDE